MDPIRLGFLKSEFQTLSLFAALGRSNTYLQTSSDKDRVAFRRALRAKLDNVAARYGSPVDDSTHAANISEIADAMTAQFSNCLRCGRFRIGIAQKCLNLYLKYLWCIGEISMPPHCPFDFTIIARLPEQERMNWTSLDKIEDYLSLVRAARTVADPMPLAEWELRTWRPA